VLLKPLGGGGTGARAFFIAACRYPYKSGGIYCQELCKLSDFSYISVYKFKIFFYIFIQNMFYRAHVKWFHVKRVSLFKR